MSWAPWPKTMSQWLHLVFFTKLILKLSPHPVGSGGYWRENIIVLEPNSNWSIWRWFTLLSPTGFCCLFGRKKQMYLEKKRLAFFCLFWFYPTLTPCVQTCFYRFVSRAQVPSLLRFKFEKQTALDHGEAKYKIHFIMASWLSAESCSSECIFVSQLSVKITCLRHRALREFTIRNPDESEVRCRWKQTNHNSLTFEFKVVRTLCPHHVPLFCHLRPYKG